MKISLLIFPIYLLLVAANAQSYYRLIANDVKNVWFDHRNAENPPLDFIAGEPAYVEFVFSGTVNHGLRLKNMQDELIPGVTNNDLVNPPQPVNLTWANPVEGSYYYVCAYHPTMRGTITVVGPPGTRVPTTTPFLDVPSATPVHSTPSSSAPTSTAPVSSAPTSTTPVSSAPTSTTPVSSAPTSTAPVSPVPSAPVSVVPVAPGAPVIIPPSSSPSANPTPSTTSAPSNASHIVASSVLIFSAVFSLALCLF